MEITANMICKAFGEKQVLNDFTHTFASGRTTVIMGPSGCGKSTLISVLMGIIPFDSGELIPDTNNFRKSAVFQENRLCENLTAASNIRLVTGSRLTAQQIAQELSSVGLEDCADKPVRELSGGMKRRVALLRALLAEYDVLFLDEPFKGLDEETKHIVIEYTRRLTTNKTVIMVTHDRTEFDALGDELITLNS